MCRLSWLPKSQMKYRTSIELALSSALSLQFLNSPMITFWLTRNPKWLIFFWQNQIKVKSDHHRFRDRLFVPALVTDVYSAYGCVLSLKSTLNSILVQIQSLMISTNSSYFHLYLIPRIWQPHGRETSSSGTRNCTDAANECEQTLIPNLAKATSYSWCMYSSKIRFKLSASESSPVNLY